MIHPRREKDMHNEAPKPASKTQQNDPSILARTMLDAMSQANSTPVTDRDAEIINQSEEPIGLRVTQAQTGATGIRVKIIDGECFGDQIVWFEDQAYEALVTVTDDPKTGLPTHLTYTYDSGHSYDKRGFEHGTNTWWRYEHEADPREYREHCLRIVEIL